MKIATIGTSFITEWFLKAVSEIEDCECVGIYSRKAETGQILADKAHVKKVYTNLDEMLTTDEIDFIYVASPNSLHYQYSLQALEAGKNVICEKPFTSTVKELEHLIEVAKEKHLFLFEAITTLHVPNYLAMKERISSLGQIKIVQCNYSQYSSRYDQFMAGEKPNIFMPEFSGGALMDINIYNTHFIMGLFGKPKDVHYFPNLAENGIDTSGILVLDYGNFKATAVGAKDTKSKNCAQIQGDKGYIYVEGQPSRCHHVEVHLNHTSEVEVIELHDHDVTLYYELIAFNDIVKQENYDLCYEKLAYSLSVMEVVHEARKKAGIVFAADLK